MPLNHSVAHGNNILLTSVISRYKWSIWRALHAAREKHIISSEENAALSLKLRAVSINYIFGLPNHALNCFLIWPSLKRALLRIVPQLLKFDGFNLLNTNYVKHILFEETNQKISTKNVDNCNNICAKKFEFFFFFETNEWLTKWMNIFYSKVLYPKKKEKDIRGK